MLYVTGDVHGYFGRIVRFCESLDAPTRDDVLVVLGDVGANFWCDESDARMRAALGSLPLTVLCVHGNHEARPDAGLGYRERAWRGGTVWADDAHPGLLFARDGSVFDLDGRSCLVAGGAYSVDKRFRLADGRRWFDDEQPGAAERAAVEAACAGRGWKVDYVFSHTAPLRFRPTEAFMASISQSEVDTTTEEWLERLELRLDYGCWLCGHFHIDKEVNPRMHVLFKQVLALPAGDVVYDAEADAARAERTGYRLPVGVELPAARREPRRPARSVG